MGFHRHRNGETFHRNWSPSIQWHQCFESWNSEKKRWQMYTSMRIHRTMNSCFAQCTQQISSVSTEQFQAGVKSSINGLRIRKSRLERSSRQKKTSIYWKNVKPQEVISLVQTPRSDNRASGKIGRTSSEIWNTGEGNQIYESLWGCDIRDKSLYWMSYKTVPDVDLRNDSRTNYKWTSSSSSYHTISWHQRNWNTGSSHITERSKILGVLFLPR